MTNDQTPGPPPIPGYEIGQLIGSGGMGEVYLARQVALNRHVAIKFLTRASDDPLDDYQARFRREAELMARVSHPHVVTIFDSGTVDGRPYLVMEYVEGGDLRSRMVPDRPLGVGAIRSILAPVLAAVGHLHSRGILHRDIKPENVLMLRDGTPKVTDFGIAVLELGMGSLTRAGLSLGTPGYIAPEQQYRLKVDARADQFSLAALGYELATGRKPLGSFPPPDSLNPRLGRAAGAVLLRALSEDPDDRFATVEEFARALDLGLDAAGCREEVPGPRRRLLVASAVLAALVVVAALLPSLLRGSARPAQAVRRPVAPPVDRAPAVLEAKSPPAAAASPSSPAPEPWASAPARLTAKSAGLSLVLVPAGEFRMGSPAGSPDAKPDESPEHPVRISRPFYLGETEVTVGQFRKYIEATGATTSAERRPAGGGEWGGGRYDLKLRAVVQDPGLTWRAPNGQPPRSDEEPVVQVSLYDALAFCDWLSKAEGRRFRLPTEAEWEYACRAGGAARWCSGDDPAALDSHAWTIRNAGYALHPVATRRPNAFGLFDMHGNAWEWCSDEYGPYVDAPGAAVDPQGPPPKQARVLRGGSFDWDDVGRTRSASRHDYPPYMCYSNYGFRVCSTGP